MCEERTTNPALDSGRGDLADKYQDHPFPGRSFLAGAVGVWLVAGWIPQQVLSPISPPEWVGVFKTVGGAVAAALYFVGFWKAVLGKGYSRILFLISFAPILGLVVIYYLPFIGGESEQE